MGDYNHGGRCCSKDKKSAIIRSKNIDRNLVEYGKSYWKEVKLLLLGSPESGKTTFMKQMRITGGNDYSEDERRGFTILVYQNIFQSMKEMTNAMIRLKIPYSNPQSEVYAQWFQDQDIHQITELQRSYVEAIHHLWADEGFESCYSRRREYHLLDSTKYFIVNLDRIAAEDYIPTSHDILCVRSPTEGIAEQCISMRMLTFRIIDVGGQRGQRKKWLHYFTDVTSLIFLASLSEYDQFLEENNETNRMEDSLSLFNATIHSPWFAETPIILFLNKKDILEEKIRSSDLKTYFPEFEGRPRDVCDATQFIQDLYEQKVVRSNRENSDRVYSHCICATDNISRLLFDNVTDIIINQNLKFLEN